MGVLPLTSKGQEATPATSWESNTILALSRGLRRMAPFEAKLLQV